ncbi:hypothetical protein HK096_007869, partial [Nowakowskiella sp. JEL0078]
LPYPQQDFSGQTIIVTGSNTGLGREAAQHITRLNASKVILAVRSIERGELAKKSIEESTKKTGVVEVWQLDLASYDSVKKFAARVNNSLDRLDGILENASIATTEFTLAEKNESSITVNVVSTFLLGLLVLPKLRESAQRFHIRPRLSIVVSDMHFFAKFIERQSSGSLFNALNDPKVSDMDDRYSVTKLLQVLLAIELTARLSDDSVIVNMLNPGLCHSELTRDAKGSLKIMIGFLKFIMARTTEAGSRTLVHAIGADASTHGKYLSDCAVTPSSKFVNSTEGKQV